MKVVALLMVPPRTTAQLTEAPTTGWVVALRTMTLSESVRSRPTVSVWASPKNLATVAGAPLMAVAWKVTNALVPARVARIVSMPTAPRVYPIAATPMELVKAESAETTPVPTGRVQ